MKEEVEIDIPYGKGKITFRVPKKNLIKVVQKDLARYQIDEEAEIKRALDNPIDTPRLPDISAGARSAVILVSDITRPCPSYKFLPYILDELKGIDSENITIILGLGIHRKHTIREQKELVGEEVFNKVEVVDFDESRCKLIGYTSRGTPVEVFEPYIDADLKICTGNIEYHYFAGYSGGAKAVMPGISSRRSIEHNHGMVLLPGVQAGVLEGNPVREDIEEVGKIAGIDFIFNVILSDRKEIIKAVCGNYLDAFVEGTKIYDKLKRQKLKEPVDIIITSPGGYPKDINLYQSQKPLENVKRAVKEGGIIILVAKCQDGMGDDAFEKWMLDMKSPDVLLERIKDKFVLGGHKAAAIADLLKKVGIYLVSSFTPEFVRRIGLEPVKSIEEALNKSFKELGEDCRVLVVPHGGFVKTI